MALEWHFLAQKREIEQNWGFWGKKTKKIIPPRRKVKMKENERGVKGIF